MIYIDGSTFWDDTGKLDDWYCDTCGHSWEVPEGETVNKCPCCGDDEK